MNQRKWKKKIIPPEKIFSLPIMFTRIFLLFLSVLCLVSCVVGGLRGGGMREGGEGGKGG